MLFVCYPKCSTCQKAKKFLETKNVDFTLRDIKINNPTKEELKKWIKLSGKDIDKFFNTSGLKYKELNLASKKKLLTDDEKLDLLALDGMLVKRPILVSNDLVLIGFKEEEYNKL